MKKKYLSFIFLLLLLAVSSYGQRTCGSELNLDAIKKNNPERYNHLMKIEKYTSGFKQPQGGLSTMSHGNHHVTIPVVVHVLHNGEAIGTGLNISMAQIQSQIDVLNEDFRRLNSDASNTPTAFSGIASDVGIEFALACIGPNGNATNGVIRRRGGNTSYVLQDSNNNGEIDQADEIAAGIKYNVTGSDAWPSDRYLNIWVCNLGNGLLGYGKFPFQRASSPETDGVVIRTNAFGRTGNVVAPYNQGRTATHEVGHWLNLRHIWGDSNCGNDFVNDTPTQAGSSSGCPTHPRPSCNSNDMFMNYMDYTNDACMNMFTQGQGNRMLAVFAPGGVRESFTDCSLLACINTPAIIGSSIVCHASSNGPTTATFTVDNLPSNSTVTWFKSPLLNTISGQNSNSFVVQAANTTGNYVWVEASVTTPCSGNPITVRKDFWAGKPRVMGDNGYPTSISLDSDASVGRNPLPCIPSMEYSSNYTYYWEIAPEDRHKIKNASTLNWFGDVASWYTSYTYGVFFKPNSLNPPYYGTGYMGVEGCNSCGCEVLITEGYAACYDPYSYAVYPNPASSEINIEVENIEALKGQKRSEELEEFEVTFINSQSSAQAAKAKSKDKKLKLNTASLPRGLYILKITTPNQSETTREILIQ